MHSRTTNHLSPAGEGGGDKEEARICFFSRGSQGDQSSPTEVNRGGDYVKLTANKGGIVRILCRRIR